ncbi:uncharacterized protein EI97DRAFT_368449 [Westerdykella ornata]|uniref:Rhodopsin domain-containing protein n=1 Tax=Westerdykella ornata TaxID=318751 RepID=A0A6A6JWP1_WESOR|nr:uncharacterized protein EI97DRAFT_368449 [Westerdykella ornata]KAF2280645.1 hypothetical protein EI97DRAFT_368449 [Westerdykella ornata]
MIPLLITEDALYHARSFAGVAIALHIVAFLTFAGRMWTRSFPVFRMAIDDYVMMLSYAFVIVDSTLLLKCVPFVFGRDPSTFTLADGERSNMYAIISQPFWAWSMCFLKVSIALMLLRLETATKMRRFLWANIAFQILLGFYNMITQLLQCIPLRAAWDLLKLTQNARCWSVDAVRINGVVVSSINVATDILFSLLPINFLRKVQRPLRERVIIGVLMALGMFAGGASMVKLVAGARFGRTDDPTAESIRIGMWSVIEGLVGIIAANVPCLRSPFQRCLAYFGLVSTHGKTAYGRGYGEMYDESSRKKSTMHNRTKKSELGGSASSASAMGIRMHSMRSPRSPDTQSEENILPADGGKHEIWCTTEVYLRADDRNTSKMKDMEKGG